MEPAQHIAVMADEVVAYLEPREDDLILDATLGLAGHTCRLLERGARVVGIDRDPRSLELAARNLADYADRCILLHGRMSQAKDLLADEGSIGSMGCWLMSASQCGRCTTGDSAFTVRSPWTFVWTPGIRRASRLTRS